MVGPLVGWLALLVDCWIDRDDRPRASRRSPCPFSPLCRRRSAARRGSEISIVRHQLAQPTPTTTTRRRSRRIRQRQLRTHAHSGGGVAIESRVRWRHSVVEIQEGSPCRLPGKKEFAKNRISGTDYSWVPRTVLVFEGGVALVTSLRSCT